MSKISGFDVYGIERLAPTMIANWDSAPATLILRRVFGVKGESNANMWRGDAVEAAMAEYLRYHDIEAAKTIADDAFLNRCDGVLDEAAERVREQIPGMVDQAKALCDSNAYGELMASQLGVEGRYEGITVPIYGKMDFAFMSGRNIELKTTTRCPSSIESASTSHRWQAAFYADARQQPVDLCYITPKKFAVFTVEPGDPILRGMLATAKALERMLGAHDEGLDLLASLPTNVDSFYWDDPLIEAYQRAIDGDLPPLKGTGTEALLRSGVITFGKHAGKHISDVPDTYLNWLLNPQLSDGGTYDVPEPLVEAIKEYKEVA